MKPNFDFMAFFMGKKRSDELIRLKCMKIQSQSLILAPLNNLICRLHIFKLKY